MSQKRLNVDLGQVMRHRYIRTTLRYAHVATKLFERDMINSMSHSIIGLSDRVKGPVAQVFADSTTAGILLRKTFQNLYDDFKSV
jgi:hypothetical protein